MKTTRILAALCACVLLSGCDKPLDDQMTEYMEFYYPSKTESLYNIIFDWGTYDIMTHEKAGVDVHADSEPFLGYITLRPNVTTPAEGLDPPIYLISPDGEVWSIERSIDIAKTSVREEVTVQSEAGMTSTMTQTINSPSEPVINHFLANQEAWTRYGTMVADGEGYELERP